MSDKAMKEVLASRLMDLVADTSTLVCWDECPAWDDRRCLCRLAGDRPGYGCESGRATILDYVLTEMEGRSWRVMGAQP